MAVFKKYIYCIFYININKHFTLIKTEQCIETNTKDISEDIRDVLWLISVGRLEMWFVVKWSRFVTT